MQEGDTITGATSGATAVLTRVALESGTFAGGTAAGTLVFASQTGTFQAENLNVGANLNVATIAGNSSAITLLPDGRFEFVIANFTGSTNTKRVYWCDGVNRAHEFDGTVTVPINTGMTTDTPTHIAGFMYHLFLSFNASVQHSGTGFPYQWTIITGAAELAVGDNVTGFAVQPSSSTAGTMAIFTKGRTSLLYGTSSSDWQLITQKDEIGAFAYTIQSLAQTMFLDFQGVTDLATSQRFGNFVYAVHTNRIKSTLAGWKTTAIASTISRDLAQYRLFFTNNYGLYITMAGEQVFGIMPVLFAHTVRCAFSGAKNDGTEVAFFGGDDGYVFEMDKGTSFDGENIEAFVYLPYNFSRGPRTLKRYRGGALEISGTNYAAFSFGYSLGYGSTDIIQPDSVTVVSNLLAALWDSMVWDAAVWDGVTLSPSTIEIEGEAENLSIAVVSSGDYYEPFTITGGVVNHTPRRQMR
jgi:hypothetical protein